MSYPFIENSYKTVQYIFVWIIFAVLQALSLYWMHLLPVSNLGVDAFIHAALFACIGIALGIIYKNANFAVLTISQRIITQVALTLLSVAVWTGGGYALYAIIYGEQSANLLISILPVRCLIGLLLYVLVYQHYQINAGRIDNTEEEEYDASLDENEPKYAEQELRQQREIIERVGVKSGTKIHIIPVSEIVCLQADGDYVQIVTEQGKYLKEQTMKFFEESLPPQLFVRVHRSCIVNVEMISRIELYEKQNQLLLLKNGLQIKVSPAGYKALRMTLNL